MLLRTQYPLLFIFTCWSFNKTFAKDIAVIGLQENGTMSPESLASFEYEASIKRDSTLCVRVNFFGLRPFVPIFMACEIGSEMRKCIRSELIEGVIFWMHYDIEMKRKLEYEVESKKWNLICLRSTFGRGSKKLQFGLFFNGEEVDSKYVPLESPHAGENKRFNVYFGQTNLESELNDGLRSFSGQIGSYLLFDRSLSANEIMETFKCKGKYLENDLLQENIDKIKLQNAEKKIIDRNDFCLRKKNLFYISFLKKRSFQESLILCQTLGGKISRPITRRENHRLSLIARRYKDFCIEHGDKALGRLIWLGMEKVNGKWIDPISKGKIQYFNWRPGLIQHNCAYMKFNQSNSNDNGFSWETTYCSDALPLNLCTMCEFSRATSPSLKIRLGGMCKTSVFDTEYFLTEPTDNSQYRLRGQTSSLIEWDTRNSTWKLSNAVYSGEAYLLSGNSYPMGRQKWILKNISCDGKLTNNKEIILSLSVCEENEFSCDDGTCVSINGRCDKIRDCSDGSDELHCFPLIIPDGYNERISPSTRKNVVNGNKVMIKLSWFIAQLTDFSSISFTMTYHYNLTWRDNRLGFKNLISGDKSLNYIENNRGLWYPRILMPLVKEYQDLNSAFIFKRNSEPRVDRSGPRENLIFEGKDTPVTFIQTGRAEFFCDFSYLYFPYDRQVCNIKMIVAQSSEQILHLIGSSVDYNKLYLSSDYIISDAYFISYNTSRIFTEVTLRISIHKIWGRPFLFFYINPFFVSAFAYSTLWLKIEETLLRLFIVFNCIFISFALLYGSLPTIPSTLYLKIVDIWNLYFLLVNFSILALHILIHVYRKKEVWATFKKMNPIYFSPMESRVVPAETMQKKSQLRSTKPSGESIARRLNNGCRTLIVLLTAFFISIIIFLILFHVLSS